MKDCCRLCFALEVWFILFVSVRLLIASHIILRSVLIWTIIHSVTLTMNAKKNGCDEIIKKLLAGMETNSDIATADP